jgi:beta-hydroxyacyl-ACP dehydratase FabZ
MLGSKEIEGILPHRYPFLLVDRVLELELGKRVVGIKNVTINEPFFVGHFPGHPIMPGVLIIEAMAQTGGVLLMQTLGTQGQKKLMYFTGIDGARFRKPVVPGDQLRLEVSVLQSKRQVFRMQGRATVEGALVAEAELSSIVVDRDPSKPPETPLLV